MQAALEAAEGNTAKRQAALAPLKAQADSQITRLKASFSAASVLGQRLVEVQGKLTAAEAQITTASTAQTKSAADGATVLLRC